MPVAYETHELPLAGGAVATLIHLRPERPRGVAFLYVHGFSDYVFQDHVAEHLAARGVGFWGLDLRRYGRSLRPGDLPAYVADVSEHFEELDAALAAVLADGQDDVVVSGHSTGGLITPLWLDARRGTEAVGHVRGLVLNSPWFELAGSPKTRRKVHLAAMAIGRVAPTRVLATLPSAYGKTLHRDYDGEWEFDLAWKPIEGFPVRAGWLRAIRRAHARLHRGLHVPAPVLLLRSDRSVLGRREVTPELFRGDAILDVRDMHEHLGDLGTDVTEVVLEGALHDVMLSALPVRTRALEELDAWMDRVLGARDAQPA